MPLSCYALEKIEILSTNLTSMTIEQITKELKNDDLSPPDLAKTDTILSGYYSYYGQMLKRIRLVKPLYGFTIWQLENVSQAIDGWRAVEIRASVNETKRNTHASVNHLLGCNHGF
jgi:hypothetical protein